MKEGENERLQTRNASWESSDIYANGYFTIN